MPGGELDDDTSYTRAPQGVNQLPIFYRLDPLFVPSLLCLLHGLNVKAGRFRESAGPGQGLCRAFGKCGEKRFVAIGFRHLLEQCFHSFQATLLVKSRKHTAHGHHGPVR